MADRVIAVIEKNRDEEIRVVLGDFKGHQLVSIRIFADPREDDGQDRVPTKKGVTCKVALLPEIIKALQDAEAVARKEGLLP